MEPELVLALFGEADTVLTQEEMQERLQLPETELKSLRRLLKRLVRDGVLMRLRGRRFKRTPTIEEQGIEEAAGGPQIGLLRVVGRAAYVEPEPDPESYGTPEPVLLDPDGLPSGAEDGALVVYEITSPRTRVRAPMGVVVRVLGRPGDRAVEMHRLLLEFELPDGFPAEVEAEARAFGDAPSAADQADRVDLTQLPLVTIDGADAKDFDDAVCAERREDGGYDVYVAIADVSHYVRPGTELDREAYRRATSTYLTDRCIPMLPENLSNGLCSLRPHVPRLCVVAQLDVDASGAVRGRRFYRAVMRSRARLTYDQVARALEGEVDAVTGPLLPAIMRLYKVSQNLLRRRIKRGSVDLDVPEAMIVFGEDGLPIDARRRPRSDAHRLIEDLMLAANEAVAAHFAERDRPTVYRIHEDPDPAKLEAVVALSQVLGLEVKLKKKVKPRDLAHLVEDLQAHPLGQHLQGLVLRTMAQARYSVEDVGHFGLAAEHYLHFTSPIRRYPDLIVHRLLMAEQTRAAVPHGVGDLAAMSEHCSTRERAAMVAERASMDLDRAFVATGVVGDHLQGTITGVQRFGLFVSVDTPFIEGMVPVATIGQDYFEADEIGSTMRGVRSGITFRLGQKVGIEVVKVDLDRRRVEMRLVQSEEELGATRHDGHHAPADGWTPPVRPGPRPRGGASPRRAGPRSGPRSAGRSEPRFSSKGRSPKAGGGKGGAPSGGGKPRSKGPKKGKR